MASPQRIWIGTLAHHTFVPFKPSAIAYIKGQLESGADNGFLHWQLVVYFGKPVRLAAIKKIFGDTGHWEPTRSAAADDYVWKDDTAIANTRFELGERPLKRNSSKDWDSIKTAAQSGRLDDIPSDVYVRSYQSLKRIACDHMVPISIEREIHVYWGPTGVGKSRRAWELAGLDAYPKDPRSKFWDGYRNHEHVVIDEFRGGIDISHVLRWFDRYPVIVEVKGSSVPLCAKKIFITSNLDPRQWYADIDPATQEALLRRLQITHIPLPIY